MKSLQKSWGKNYPFFKICIFLSLMTSLGGCAMISGKGHTTRAEPPEYETSLQEDKKEIEELRKNIPEEKRRENDQLKEFLSLMGEVKDPPNKIRDRFYRITEKMRQVERRENQQSRKNFNKEEKRKREEFYDAQKKERDDFKNHKSDREVRKRFFDEQDQRRRDFTADERDKRNQYNADMKMREDDFNTNMRDKNNEFNQELRAYTTRYNDYIKTKKEKTKPTTHEEVMPLKAGSGD